MKHLLLVDGNSLSHASFWNNDLAANGVNTGLPFMFINSLHGLIASELASYKPLVLWDKGSSYRKQIYPHYKENRRADTPEKERQIEDFKEQRGILQRLLPRLGIVQMSVDGFEADDLAHSLVEANQDSDIVLLTGDRDWLQMLRPGVVWMEHRMDRRRLVGSAQFEQETGVKTRTQFLEVKALAGDSSDNIPGVGGIGEKGAKRIVLDHGGLNGFLEAAKRGDIKLTKVLQRLVDNEPFVYRNKEYDAPLKTFERNLQLIDLSRAPKIKQTSVEVQHPLFDPDVVRDLCEQYQYRSWLDRFDRWIKPFAQQLQ